MALKTQVIPRREVGYDWVPEERTAGQDEVEHLERSGELRGWAGVENENGEGKPTRSFFFLGWNGVQQNEGEALFKHELFVLRLRCAIHLYDSPIGESGVGGSRRPAIRMNYGFFGAVLAFDRRSEAITPLVRSCINPPVLIYGYSIVGLPISEALVASALKQRHVA